MAGNVYNEIVVDTASVVGGLPHSVEAFFYVKGGDSGAVRNHHANFLRTYNLGSGRDVGSNVPLVQLDFGSPEAPFTLDSEFAGR